MLLAGLALVAYAGGDREPGPGYLGVLVLVGFVIVAALGEDASVGWPLLLVGSARRWPGSRCLRGATGAGLRCATGATRLT